MNLWSFASAPVDDVSRVLVVEDDARIRKTLEVNLRARGYDVDVAETGEDALQLAARHHPDAVILDLGLPTLDGMDVVRGLRGWTSVPIVVLSARVRKRRRSKRSISGPTTTSRSRSAWTSCSRACVPRCGARSCPKAGR